MTRRLSLLGVLLFTIISSSGQDRSDTIRVDVQTVSVDVEVFDSTGRPVIGLTPEDFRVYEDGRPQELRNFASVETPYNVVLLFDCSESTRGHWSLIMEAVAQFSRYKRPEDRVLLAAFGSKVQVIQNWDSQKRTLETVFERDERVCQLTQFHGALGWAFQELRNVKTRRGVVILTDGVDSAPDATADSDYQRALNTFRGSGIPIYFIAVGTDLNPSPGIPGKPPDVRERMEELAAVSGGRVVFPKKAEEMIPMYEQIARELGTSYSLGYTPPNAVPDGKRHRIEVRLPTRNFQIRQSRNDYVWR